jgi:hypothetical protein
LDALAFEIYSELMVAKEIKRDTNWICLTILCINLHEPT